MYDRSNTSVNQQSDTKETMQKQAIQQSCTQTKGQAIVDGPTKKDPRNLQLKQSNTQQKQTGKQHVDENDDTKKKLAQQIFGLVEKHQGDKDMIDQVFI